MRWDMMCGLGRKRGDVLRWENDVASALTRLTGRRVSLTRGLLCLAAISIALGTIGWFQYERAEPDVDLDLLAAVYGTLGLFAFVADVASAPWPLAVARILAPVTTVGVALAALLAFSDTRIHRWAAATAREHLVVLGPSGRAAPYLRPRGAAPVVRRRISIVRLDTDDEPGGTSGTEPTTAAVRVEMDPFRTRRDSWDSAIGPRTTDWLHAANATHAAWSVIATGRDDWNVAALGVALAAGLPGDGQSLTIEIDDRSTALRLAVALAVESTTSRRDVRVVCRDEIVAALAVDRIHAALAQVDRSIVVVGDGPMVPLVAAELGRRLHDEFLPGDATRRPSLTLLDADGERVDRHLDWLPTARSIDLTVGADPSVLLRDGGPPVVAFVDFVDPSKRIRFAIELAANDPGNLVVALLGTGPHPFPDRIQSLDACDALGPDELRGPFERASATTAPAALRAMTAELVDCGYSVRPSTSSDGHCELDRRTLERLTVTAGGDPDAAQDLVVNLRSVGLAVRLREPVAPGDAA